MLNFQQMVIDGLATVNCTASNFKVGAKGKLTFDVVSGKSPDPELDYLEDHKFKGEFLVVQGIIGFYPKGHHDQRMGKSLLLENLKEDVADMATTFLECATNDFENTDFT
jgi:hypothetical protein